MVRRPFTMPSTLEEAYLQKNPKKKLVIGVAIDGSNISDKALATACGFYNAARGDRLVILHVSDSSKTFLPRHLQPKHLESQYVDKAHSLKVRVQPATTAWCKYKHRRMHHPVQLVLSFCSVHLLLIFAACQTPMC
jgi:hypothetical protein